MHGCLSFFAQDLVNQKFIILHRQDTHQAIWIDVHIKELQDVRLDTSGDLNVEFKVIRFENVKVLVIIITCHQVAIHFFRIFIEIDVLDLAIAKLGK